MMVKKAVIRREELSLRLPRAALFLLPPVTAFYLMQFLYGAWPWQTYLDYDINFEGRIALSPSIRFGLGGLLFLYVLQPLFQRLVGSLSSRARLAASGAVVVLLAAECVLLLFR